MKTALVKGMFLNLYEWGEGWNSKTAERWDEYLENYKGAYWRAIPPKRKGGCWQLITTSHNVYLHPMNFVAMMYSTWGRSYRGNDDELEDIFGDQLDELYELCYGLAKHCGGDFRMGAEMLDEVAISTKGGTGTKGGQGWYNNNRKVYEKKGEQNEN